MDHVVFVEASSKEIDKLLLGDKTMILRGAMGRKMPYGRVNENDILYFINNNGEGTIKAKARVKTVFNSEKLSPEESSLLISKYEDKLLLSAKQKNMFSGKRYLVMIEVDNAIKIEEQKIDKSNFSNMDDWLDVGTIEQFVVKN
jgi:hypothetical protein